MVSLPLRFGGEFGDLNISNVGRDQWLGAVAKGAWRNTHCKLPLACSTLAFATPTHVDNPHTPFCSLRQLSHELALPAISDEFGQVGRDATNSRAQFVLESIGLTVDGAQQNAAAVTLGEYSVGTQLGAREYTPRILVDIRLTREDGAQNRPSILHRMGCYLLLGLGFAWRQEQR